MARYIPQWLSGVVQALELERPTFITAADLKEIVEAAGLATPANVISDRLRRLGWLLETPQRGVWEFAPAENAGAFSSADPLLPIKAFALAHNNLPFALTLQTAAWALGLADRVPSNIEVAFAERPAVKVPSEIAPSVFASSIGTVEAKGVPCLRPESIIVHMAAKPAAVRSWQSALEWLPDVAYEIDLTILKAELNCRADAVKARTGYLLSGLRPDAASAIGEGFNPVSKTRFGPREHALRNDERWMVSDTLLPFDPRKLEAVL